MPLYPDRCCRTILFVLLLLCRIAPCCAQDGVALKGEPDTAVINRLRKQARKLKNRDSAMPLLNTSLRMSIAANYADGAANALIDMGKYFMNDGEYEKSLIYLTEAIPWSQKAAKKDILPGCYNNIGLAYFYQADYINASANYYKALAAFRDDSTPSRALLSIYTNLFMVNYRLHQPDNAIAYLQQAERLCRKGNFLYELSTVLTNKGGVYFELLHKTDSALLMLHEAAEIARLNHFDETLAYANENIGEVFVKTKLYEQAITYLQTAISLSRDKFLYVFIDASYTLGEALYHMQQYKQAEAILVSAIAQAEKAGLKDNTIKGYTTLKDVYKATGQYKKTVATLETLTVLKDTLTGIEKNKALNQMEARYKIAEKDKEIAQNQLLIARQKNNITRKNVWIAAIFAGVFLLGFVLLAMGRHARNKQRLQAGQIKTLQQENTISILKGMVQGEDKERSRIARELHDGIGGMLSAARMRFMTIKQEHDEITTIPAYKEAMNMLSDVGDEIRKTAHNLMPDALMKQALPEAIRTFCNNMQEDGLHIDFQSYGTFDELPQHFKLNIYRIVQELLKNVVQHAHATSALVQLMMHEHSLTVTVEDNGRGYDTGETNGGIGLHNLQTRVRNLEGTYTIESEHNRGTSVFIEFDTRMINEPYEN
ncbi:MAG: tetratricopeptide repeat protein [Bacteroidota bacterium]